MSSLYLAATPIGNLEDITLRVLRILKEVPLIAAEDTRKTSQLLNHYQVSTPLTSYHDHNKKRKTSTLLEHLRDQDLALVSDAGTPAVNDPGYNLVRSALEHGHQIIPLPGPSAPLAALSASGLPSDRFLYLGYLPRKTKARRDLLAAYRTFPHTLVCLETPHRLVEGLLDLVEVLGDRKVVIGREITKIHEEFFRGKASQAHQYYQNQPPRGEITLVIQGAEDDSLRWSREQLLEEVQQKTSAGQESPSQLAKNLSEQSGWARTDVYDLIIELKNN